MRSVNGVILLLSLSSYWQVASGYVDVFSHRFVFKTVDPALNPAHLSLYAASLLGFIMVCIALWGGDDSERRRTVRPAMLVVFTGAIGEIGSGTLNELYHRIFANTPITTPAHLAIHSLFVVCMFLVAAGGLASAALLHGSKTSWVDQRYVAISFGIVICSVWMLLIGSASYLAAFFAGDAGGFYFLVAGSFLVSSVSVSALLLTRRFGFVTFAAFSFFIFNAVLLYGFERNAYLLPAPVLSAALGEVLARRVGMLGKPTFSAVSGTVFGALSYWLLYPYSYSFYGFVNIPTTYFGFDAAAIVVSGAAGGVVAFLIIRGAASLLATRFGT
ncbi:MAG: hypothetical protein HYY68_01265 [Thaumarchaeota archaeon]|nr:hypothetical protein [Nitrososphaerota archaeon]